MQYGPSLRSGIGVRTPVQQNCSEFIVSVSGGKQKCIEPELRYFRGAVREPAAPARVDRQGVGHAGSGIEQSLSCADLSLAGSEQKRCESSLRTRLYVCATLDQRPDD